MRTLDGSHWDIIEFGYQKDGICSKFAIRRVSNFAYISYAVQANQVMCLFYGFLVISSIGCLLMQKHYDLLTEFGLKGLVSLSKGIKALIWEKENRRHIQNL